MSSGKEMGMREAMWWVTFYLPFMNDGGPGRGRGGWRIMMVKGCEVSTAISEEGQSSDMGWWRPGQLRRHKKGKRGGKSSGWRIIDFGFFIYSLFFFSDFLIECGKDGGSYGWKQWQRIPEGSEIQASWFARRSYFSSPISLPLASSFPGSHPPCVHLLLFRGFLRARGDACVI